MLGIRQHTLNVDKENYPMKSALKSNTWVVVLPTVLWFVLGFAYVQFWQPQTNNRYDYLMAAGLGVPFIAMALAQLRSGYIWRNLAPGNRGEHKSDKPKRFLSSTILDLAVGLGIVLCFVYLYSTRTANKPSIPTPDWPRVQTIMIIQPSTQKSALALAGRGSCAQTLLWLLKNA